LLETSYSITGKVRPSPADPQVSSIAHAWVTQAIRNLVIDLQDAGTLARLRYMIRDRDAKYPDVIDAVLHDVGIATVLAGVRIPRMNAITERWVKTFRIELLDRTLV
jgi:hypothetical protein